MEDVVLPRCLNDLLSFVNMKTINEILQITKYFWEACNEDLDASQLSWKNEVQHEKYLDYDQGAKSNTSCRYQKYG
ncbi:hypothetical protein G6F56_005773 [Rhizopus delemar]|nr:hypothetical protein G6F56_005773 [Rhizopus delemar]